MSEQNLADFFRSLIDEWMPGAKHQGSGGGLREVVDSALGAAHISTRSDLDRLEARLSELEQTVARLERQLAKSSKKTKKARKGSGS